MTPTAKIRVGINGCGRIGRAFLRHYFNLVEPSFAVVVIHDVMPLAQLQYLLEFDSVHGRCQHPISIDEKAVALQTCHGLIGFERGKSLPSWDNYQVDIVLELTGQFSDDIALQTHLNHGASRVLLCAPLLHKSGQILLDLPAHAKGLMPGESIDFSGPHRIFSAFSCTTQAFLTLLKPLQDQKLPIQSIMVTEIHGYTAGQRLIDGPHDDWRRGRSATQSIIPTATQGIFGVEYFYPELSSKIAGFSIRVPIPNVAALNVCFHLDGDYSLTEITTIFRQAQALKTVNGLGIEQAPTVSVDYQGRLESAVLATDLCQINHRQLRLYAWYDNEYAYAMRLVESLSSHAPVH